MNINNIIIKYKSKPLDLNIFERPDNRYKEIEGTLENELKETIGLFNLYTFDLRYKKNDPVYFDIFDSYDQEVFNYYKTLFNTKTDRLKDKILMNFNDYIDTEEIKIIIFREMQIIKKYRKCNISFNTIKMMWNILKTDNSILILKPFPLQKISNEKLKTLEKEMYYNEFKVNEKKAITKLQKHWGIMGLKKISDGLYFTSYPKF